MYLKEMKVVNEGEEEQVCIHERSRLPSRLYPPSKSITNHQTDLRTNTPSYRVVAHDKKWFRFLNILHQGFLSLKCSQ